MLPIDRWIMERVNETTIRAAQLLNEFEIGQARHEIDELFGAISAIFILKLQKNAFISHKSMEKKIADLVRLRCITVFLESLSCMRFIHRI